MNLVEEFWFCSPVWFVDIPEINTEQIKMYCLSEETKYDGRKYSNIGGWQGDDFILNTLPVFDELNNVIKICLKELELKYDIKENCEFYADNSWININRYKDYNKSHFHRFSVLSSVFYVDVTDESSVITFETPNILQSSFEDPSYFNHRSGLTLTEISYPAQNNRLIFFPSWLKHRVAPNMSNNPRISIATNYGIRLR